MKSSIVKSLQELDFLSNYAAGPDGATKRGSQFINSTVTGYDQAVQTFAEGKAVFIKNGNWIYSNVADIAPEVADRLIMLPMKLNFSDDDIHVDGLTVDQMNALFRSSYLSITSSTRKPPSRKRKMQKTSSFG